MPVKMGGGRPFSRSPSSSFVFQDSNAKSFCSEDPGTEEKCLRVGISEKSHNNTEHCAGLAGVVLGSFLSA